MCTLNVCLCSSILEEKMELFKEILLLWGFACTAPSRATFHPAITTGYLCHTAKGFFHIRQFYPFSTRKTDVLPGQGKRGFSSLGLRFQQSQHLISNFTSCKRQPKIPQTRDFPLLWKRWKIGNFCEKPH